METIEILFEGTIEVKDNQNQILVSRYESIMAKSKKKSITEIFKSFNKPINDLQHHGKYYETKDITLKFFLTFTDILKAKYL